MAKPDYNIEERFVGDGYTVIKPDGGRIQAGSFEQARQIIINLKEEDSGEGQRERDSRQARRRDAQASRPA